MRKDCLLLIHREKYAEYKRLINSHTWHLLRAKKIASQPLCEDCLRAGRTRVAEEVHHERPVESGRDAQEMRILAYSFDNLVSLCRECHILRHNPQKLKNQRETEFTKKFFGGALNPGSDF